MCRTVSALALLLSLAACGGGQSDESATPGEEEAAEPVSDEGKSWGGWRWKGKRDDCFFVYKNRCFDELEAACKAAGCTGDRCEHDDAAPANVTCK